MAHDASNPATGQIAPSELLARQETTPSAGQAAPSPAPASQAAPPTQPAQGKPGSFGKAQSIVDVTIDNMSDGGAHIRMLSSHGLPGEFYLAEASRGIIHRAEVAWRTATGMGLRLLGPLEDAAAREAFLRKFRRG